MSSKPIITLIYAEDSAGLIGNNNAMAWHIPEDLRFFKETTVGHYVIMGINTYRSLPTPLKDRRCYILSTSVESIEGLPENYKLVVSTNAALADISRLERANGSFKDYQVFIIGGAQLFNEYGFAHCDIILRTCVLHNFLPNPTQGDTPVYVQKIDNNIFVRMSSSGILTSKNGHLYQFEKYVRKSLVES